MVLKRVNEILNQTNATLRIDLMRSGLSLVAIVIMLTWPEWQFVTELLELLSENKSGSLFLQTTQLLAAQWIAVVSLLAWMLTKHPVFGATGLLLYGGLSWLNVCLTPDLWNYNTHIFFYIALVVCRDFLKKHSATIDPYILAFMQFNVGLIYFQAFISKLLYGGLDWFLSGTTIYQYTLSIGTEVGKMMMKIPNISNYLGITTLIFEASFGLCLFVFWRHRTYLAIAAILFHVGIWIVMGISFWHLWVLYPILFIDGMSRKPVQKTGRPRVGSGFIRFEG